MGRYELYLKEHMHRVEQSGYHDMTIPQQRVVALISTHTYYSFLESVELVQKCISSGWSLETIKEVYHLGG